MKTYAVLAMVLALPCFGCTRSARSPDQGSEKDYDRVVGELEDATGVLREMSKSTDLSIARREGARCVVVAPSVVNGGLLISASHGHGLVTCRTESGWSGPAFVRLSGGGAGLQAGVQSSDLLIIVTSERAMGKLFESSFQLGADASVAAGPTGEAAKTAGDVKMDAEFLTYGRSKGLFAGVQLSGVWIKHDVAAAAALYGSSADVHAILAGSVPPPDEARAFLQQVAAAFPRPGAPAQAAK